MVQKVSNVQSVRLEHLTQGTYQIVRSTDSGLSHAVATEYENDDLSTVVVASGADKLYSWVKGQHLVWNTGGHSGYEWFVIRQNAGTAAPDMDNSDTVEVLHKEKRIYARGLIHQPNPVYQRLKPITYEFYNVRLRDGEELQLIIKPFVAVTSTVSQYNTVEYRIVGE